METTTDKGFRPFLIEEMEARGWDSYRLAHECQCSVGMIEDYLLGKRSCSGLLLAALANGLGVSVEMIRNLEDSDGNDD